MAGLPDELERLRVDMCRVLSKAQGMHDRVVALRAELAALKARRCDGCKYWDGEPNSGGVGYCDKGVVLETGARSFTVPPDFCCKHWTPKETEDN